MTMPYWAERLRVRLIHELGGYTAEDIALSDIAFRLKRRGVAQFCVIPWVEGAYALKATLRVAVPDKP